MAGADQPAWRHDLETGRTLLTALGPGLVFGVALARRHTAFTRVRPDGDEPILLDADGVVRRGPLPTVDGAPRRGGTPWEGVQRRAVAASPGSDWIAVTRGGHGEAHIIDAETGHGAARPRLTPSLHHGGDLTLRVRDDGADGDPVGR
ncbi:hypothetical protein [Streptomyces sp. NPDC017890]|uniref:hypothetical protein n=1 Tax=Streptomyces sp. NPDC017890 TaxID=3365015 RepID=UPI0037BC524F